MTTTKLAAFMRQPSTVLGLSTLVGTVTAFITGELTWQGAVPAIAGALAAIMLPDNHSAQAAVKDAATAVVVAEQKVAGSVDKKTVVLSVAKTATTAILLVAASLGLSACAVQSSTQARPIVDLRTAYAVTHDAATAYITAPSATPSVTAQLDMLDASALMALVAFSAARGGR